LVAVLAGLLKPVGLKISGSWRTALIDRRYIRDAIPAPSQRPRFRGF
jgi:hypothetical protein